MKVEQNYLWLPVKRSEKTKNCTVSCNGQLHHEFDIRVDDRATDFYAYLRVDDLHRQNISFDGAPIGYVPQVEQHDRKPPRNDKRRPKLHFTADVGWINDPNGLLYHQGVYHLFFQHNPFGADWGNMTWGHATSTDLMHWEQQDTALYPDATGTMFSGCGFVDTQNKLGLGADTLLFYYTAAGGHNQWSKGLPFTQRLALSTDGGKSLQKSDRFLMPHIVGENRDPKVFWHEASQGYVMVLYLDENDFSIFRSTDLQNWEETQRLTLPKLWECPDLLELAIDGDESRLHWVFLSADGYYHSGTFDGYSFTPDGDMRMGYQSRLPYAAQSFANMGKRKVIVAWLRTTNRDTCHTGSMSLPLELGLTDTQDGLTLTVMPAKEVDALRVHTFHMGNVERTPLVSLDGNSAELEVQFPASASGQATLLLNEAPLVVDFDTKTMTFQHETVALNTNSGLHLRVFMDYEVLEIFANKTIYLALENESNQLEEVSLTAETPAVSFNVHFLSSIL